MPILSPAAAVVTISTGAGPSVTVAPVGAVIGLPGSCVDSNHFQVDSSGALSPQPWMQYRCVGSVSADPVAMSFAPTVSVGNGGLISALTDPLGYLFGATGLAGLGSPITGIVNTLVGELQAIPLGLATSLLNLLGHVGEPNPADVAGGAKNIPLYTLVKQWVNTTPVNQWVYGLVTVGGIRVTVQARTRMYVVVSSGFTTDDVFAAPLSISSVVGCGANIGLGGSLNIGTAYCIMEVRQNASTFPVAPELPGWTLLAPGEKFTAAAQVTLASPYWETSSIDGGEQDTETSFEIGGTRLDVFALPAL